MRIEKLIAKGEINTLIFYHWQILSTNSFKETYGDQFGELVCGYIEA